jgi:hypothetical protein
MIVPASMTNHCHGGFCMFCRFNQCARSIVAALAVLAMTAPLFAQEEGVPFSQRFIYFGKVAPSSAFDIAENDWSVGGETIDRAYSTFEEWSQYLGPLGAKRLRLQAGWARVEATRGAYDFSWLDPVVHGSVEQGVKPWINLSYGNMNYVGGGTGLHDSDLPHDEALGAWLDFVRATVERYRGQVHEWEIWNEPERWTGTSPEGYAEFAFQTARVIRSVQPDAYIILGSFSAAVLRRNASRRPFAEETLRHFIEIAGPGYADAVSYHGYSENPDAIYGGVDSFLALLDDVDSSLDLWQGEAGAPSLNQPQFAMRDHWWTEESQAKWILRRMLGDAGRSIRTSVFTMVDLHYARPTDEFGEEITAEFGAVTGSLQNLNSKGLLETTRYAPGTPDDDQSVLRPKMAYRSVQALAAILDSSFTPKHDVCQSEDETMESYSFTDAEGRAMVALWRNVGIPGQNPEHLAVDVTCTGFRLSANAYYVDLLTTATYQLRDDHSGGDLAIKDVPIYDSPILLIDADLVRIW